MPLAVTDALAATAAGCHGDLQPYETKDADPTRLDGEKTAVDPLDIAEAVRRHPKEPIYVRGYLLAPFDDTHRLCTRLEQTGRCHDPSLSLDTSAVDLFEADALETGCCSTGHWSPKPIVLRVQFRGKTARVLD
jgi:hypothetical protein